jgi:hypothetical protein
MATLVWSHSNKCKNCGKGVGPAYKCSNCMTLGCDQCIGIGPRCKICQKNAVQRLR